MALSCHIGVRALCLRAIRQAIATLRGHISAARRAADPEGVHRLRTSARRLRNALRVCEDCFGARAETWRKGIKDLAKALGEARDLDVQILYLRDFAKKAKRPQRPGVRRLELRLSQRREGVQEQVVEAIAQLRRRRVLESISGAMGRVPRVSDDAAQRELVRKAARGSILQMRRKLAAFDKDIRDARRYRRHHEMRISAKHLRYTMEILAGVYGRKLDPFIEEVKELQKRLGELHDCDVWLEYLPRFERRERTRTIEYFGDGAAVKELAPGIKAVARDRAKARPKLHGWSLKQWQRMAPSSRWWRELDDLLRQCT